MSRKRTILAELGHELPPTAAPKGRFVPGVCAGDLLFLSGAIGTVFRDGAWGMPVKGKLGGGVSLEHGRRSAELCALHHLAQIEAVVGSLERVRRVVKLSGYVNAAPGFTKAPLALDGASDLLIAVFGDDRGPHARIATSQPEMSFDAPIETDPILQIEPK